MRVGCLCGWGVRCVGRGLLMAWFKVCGCRV